MKQDNNALSWKRVLILAGAVIAFQIGSGFATGQEIIQYFTAYGVEGLLTLAVFFVIFLYYNFNFAKAGSEENFEKANDIYKFYCGKYLGTFYDYYSTIFCYMSFWVMIGGAASTLHQEYHLPLWIGAVILAVLTAVTVAGGLDFLVDAIGIVGPIIVIICIVIGIITLFRDGGDIQAGLDTIANGTYAGAKDRQTIHNAGANWLISGLSYAGFALLWFASFMTALGKKNTKKNLYYGIIGGTIAVSIAISLISFAQIANINTPNANGSIYVWDAAIPNLILAMKIWKPFSAIFAVIVFAGIYTSAVPLLYNPASRFAKEGTKQFKIFTIVLAMIGLIVGLFLPFKILVNYIYVLNGYVGAVLVIFMIWKNIKDTFLNKKRAD